MTKYNYVVNEKKAKGPQKLSCSSVGRFIFNPKTGAFLGRTASSWAKIILFYMIFYAVLGGYFAFFGWVTLQTLDDRFPMFTLDESLIGTTPGLGFRPMPIIQTKDDMLISYNLSSRNYTGYTTRLSQFLEEYKTATANSSLVPCEKKLGESAEHLCIENVDNWSPCTKENDFGYKNGTPCVFVKLNKIIGWKPEYYEADKLPDSMPQELRTYVDEVNRSHPEQLKTIWVSCKGDTAGDRENVGPIRYIPRRGFWGYYFPYTNQPHYVSPLMAIQFQKPARNVVITVECRAWAKNIEYDHQFVEGSVLFQIKIDD